MTSTIATSRPATLPSTTSTYSSLARQLGDLTIRPPPSAMFVDPHETGTSVSADVGLRLGSNGGPPSPSSGSGTSADTPALLQFIEHLLSPEHADTDPRLLAIGYELEALLSIYPDAVKLSMPTHTLAPSSSSFTDSPNPNHSTPAPPEGISKSSSATSIPDDPHLSGLGSAPMSPRPSWEVATTGLEAGERIRYEVALPAWEKGDDLGLGRSGGEGQKNVQVPSTPPKLRVLVSLPPTYPTTSPPQLQLLGRYLGSFPIDAGLFGEVTRTYISSSGVPFNAGDVCVFEGLTHAQSLSRAWYASRLSEGAEGERAREAARRQGSMGRAFSLVLPDEAAVVESEFVAANSPIRPSVSRATFSYSNDDDEANTDESKVTSAGGKVKSQSGKLDIATLKIISSEPIVDRKSTFIGHAVKVTDERDVPLVIHELLSDRKIAKAAHPAIFAYRIAKEVGGAAGKVINSDYDDDGETQAGARLKHLLEILELENVLVVVSRWYGGTLLGPDRFKHINQAARDALDLAGLLVVEEGKLGGGGRRKK